MPRKHWPYWLKGALIFGIVLLPIVTVAILFFFFNKASETNEVRFCGRTYQIKPIFLDGTELFQRISEIETLTKYPAVQCDNLIKLSQNELLPWKFGKCKGYPSPQQCLQFDGGLFIFDPSSHNIYLPGFDGRVFYGSF